MEVFEKIEKYEGLSYFNEPEDKLYRLKKDLRLCAEYLLPFRRDREKTVQFCNYLKAAVVERQEKYASSGFPKISTKWKELCFPLRDVLGGDYSFGYALSYIEQHNGINWTIFSNRTDNYSDDLIYYSIDFDIDEIVAGCNGKTPSERKAYYMDWLARSRAINTFKDEEKNYGVKKKVETFLSLQIVEEQQRETLSSLTISSELDSSTEYEKHFLTDEIRYNLWQDKLPVERAKVFSTHPNTYKSTALYDVRQNKVYFVQTLKVWLDKYANEPAPSSFDYYETLRKRLKLLFDDYMARVSVEFSGNFFPLQFLSFQWASDTSTIIKETMGEYLGERQQSVVYICLLMCLEAHKLSEEYIEHFRQDFWRSNDIVLYNFWGDDYLKNLRELQESGVPSYQAPQLTDFAYNKNQFYYELSNRIKAITDQYLKSQNAESEILSFFKWQEQLLDDYVGRLLLTPDRSSFEINMSVNHWMNVTQSFVYLSLNYKVYEYLDHQERYHDTDEMNPKSSAALRLFFTNFCAQTVRNSDLIYKKGLALVMKCMIDEDMRNRKLVESEANGDAANDKGCKTFELSGIEESRLHDLYKHMSKNKMFNGPDDLAEDNFVADILSGDFSRIYAKPRKTACKVIINELKDHFGSDWFDAVAKSMGKDRKQLDKFRNSGYNFSNDFLKVFPL